MAKEFVPEIFSIDSKKYKIQIKLSKYLPRWFTKFFADIYVFSHKKNIDIDAVLLSSVFMEQEYSKLEQAKQAIEIQHDSLAGAAQLIMKLDSSVTKLLKKLEEKNDSI